MQTIRPIKGKLRKKPDLNRRQQKFVDYFVQIGNATEAAKKAGYSDKSSYQIGCELLKNAKIRVAIDDKLKKLESERIAEDKEILEYLTAVMRGKIDDEVVENYDFPIIKQEFVLQKGKKGIQKVKLV